MDQSLIVCLLHTFFRPSPNARMTIPFVRQVGPVAIGVGQVSDAIAAPRFRIGVTVELVDVLGVVREKRPVPRKVVRDAVIQQ